MKLFFSTYFTGLQKNASFISIGIIAENGKKFYAEMRDYDENQCKDEGKKNVLSNLFLPKIPLFSLNEKVNGMPRIGEIIKKHDVEYVITSPASRERANAIHEYSYITNCEPAYNRCTKRDCLLREWINEFDEVEFVSDVCLYSFPALVDLITAEGSVFDLPQQVSLRCHDVNLDIARYYGVTEKEALNKSREEIVMQLYGKPISGRRHNSLHDAEAIKAIYEKLGAKS